MNGVRDAQQQRVLDVAIELFAEHGFDDVTMAEIAEAADVARATVFNYFGSKHGLIEAITETVIVFYREMLDEALADEHTPAPEQLGTLYARWARASKRTAACFAACSARSRGSARARRGQRRAARERRKHLPASRAHCAWSSPR